MRHELEAGATDLEMKHLDVYFPSAHMSAHHCILIWHGSHIEVLVSYALLSVGMPIYDWLLTVRLWPVFAGGRKEGGDGIRGMKGVGVRELTYRIMFIANAAQVRSKHAGKLSTAPAANLIHRRKLWLGNVRVG